MIFPIFDFLKMTRIISPAVRIEQDGKPVFLTSFTVDDLMTPGFYRVEELVAETADGYQRVMDKRRARSFAKDVAELKKSAFLPTSILLATEKNLDYDADKREISFEPDDQDPFFLIVDGQHRAAGLQMAAMKLDGEWLREFPVAAVVAAGLNEAEQMVQFLVVNSTQKKVSLDVGQQILAQFTSRKGVDKLPDLPGWIRTKIDTSADHKALALVRHLNDSPNSPWHGKIQMANEEKTPDMTAKQSMFVESLKKDMLTHKHPLALQQDVDKRGRMLENYWRAVVHCFLGARADENDQNNPLFKSIGVHLFHQASKSVFGHLARTNNFTEDAFCECFKAASESDILDDNARAMFHPDWWKRGGPASGLNSGAVRKFADALSDAVEGIDEGDDESIFKL